MCQKTEGQSQRAGKGTRPYAKRERHPHASSSPERTREPEAVGELGQRSEWAQNCARRAPSCRSDLSQRCAICGGIDTWPAGVISSLNSWFLVTSSPHPTPHRTSPEGIRKHGWTGESWLNGDLLRGLCSGRDRPLPSVASLRLADQTGCSLAAVLTKFSVVAMESAPNATKAAASAHFKPHQVHVSVSGHGRL